MRPALTTDVAAKQSPDLVHVWRIDLDNEDRCAAQHEALLAADEQARASRFRFAQDRARFIATRGVLRSILAEYLGGRPDAIRLQYSKEGKPALDWPHAPPVHFNVSHAGRVACIAVARSCQVGIDVEPVARAAQAADAIRLVTSDTERRVIDDLPPAERSGALLQLWTSKEAYAKADGRGFGVQLAETDMLSIPGRVLLMTRLGGWMLEPRWSVQQLQLGSHYVGAIAAEGEGWNVQLRTWATGCGP